MNNNLVIISGITVSLLVVILLFKLNKTKIEYDNKLLVLNRKVRDLTNLVDLSNTKNSLLENSNNLQPSLNNQAPSDAPTQSQIENQYQEFVSTNENFFDNLENYDAPIPEDVKENIDTLLTNEQPNEPVAEAIQEAISGSDNVKETEVLQADNGDNMYANLDSFSFEQQPQETMNNLSEDVSIEHFISQTENNLFELNETQTSQVDLEELENIDKEDINFGDNNLLSKDEDGELEEGVDSVGVESEADVVESVLAEVKESEPDVVESVLAEVKESEPDVVESVLEEVKESEVDFDNLENLNVKELQEICRNNKLKIKGRKDELIERIKNFFSVDKL